MNESGSATAAPGEKRVDFSAVAAGAARSAAAGAGSGATREGGVGSSSGSGGDWARAAPGSPVATDETSRSASDQAERVIEKPTVSKEQLTGWKIILHPTLY